MEARPPLNGNSRHGPDSDYQFLKSIVKLKLPPEEGSRQHKWETFLNSYPPSKDRFLPGKVVDKSILRVKKSIGKVNTEVAKMVKFCRSANRRGKEKEPMETEQDEEVDEKVVKKERSRTEFSHLLGIFKPLLKIANYKLEIDIVIKKPKHS